VAVFGLAFGSLAFLTAHRAHLFGVFLLLSAAKAPAGITAGVLRGFSMGGESDIRICWRAASASAVSLRFTGSPVLAAVLMAIMPRHPRDVAESATRTKLHGTGEIEPQH
jgi:hypothetical protein